ncbi:MAG: 2-dehydropantoate 2-reductase N-terminal domain-containing protein, partial [Candidatus Omnitrophica bacterium]|nr:2-dehydropantoate 2-reductase N-terminal domain-containing protein [Candidatus Omnitrophota bacterium]
MKIAIVGPGAMGCLLAAFLARSKQDVYLLDKNSERARKIDRDGIKVEGLAGEFNIKVSTTSKPGDIGACDLIIIAV